MPSLRKYGPYRELSKNDFRNPNGVFSGMTLGLAQEDGEHVVVQNMPKDTRNSGVLKNKNPYSD